MTFSFVWISGNLGLLNYNLNDHTLDRDKFAFFCPHHKFPAHWLHPPGWCHCRSWGATCSGQCQERPQKRSASSWFGCPRFCWVPCSWRLWRLPLPFWYIFFKLISYIIELIPIIDAGYLWVFKFFCRNIDWFRGKLISGQINFGANVKFFWSSGKKSKKFRVRVKRQKFWISDQI